MLETNDTPATTLPRVLVGRIPVIFGFKNPHHPPLTPSTASLSFNHLSPPLTPQPPPSPSPSTAHFSLSLNRLPLPLPHRPHTTHHTLRCTVSFTANRKPTPPPNHPHHPQPPTPPLNRRSQPTISHNWVGAPLRSSPHTMKPSTETLVVTRKPHFAPRVSVDSRRWNPSLLTELTRSKTPLHR
jgi:hypothetical protein